ncbi:hypothetical protein [Actinomadura rubrisoli]|uniref:WD40 repeat domain-containing protein n=1 Tax=Actinomadura rubrisoli TaxID=2530368 RepID=A0A4R5BKL8_9ACTN|nr:hypothetical protein [Actinomadura rubrisoli]TDD86375.1 hypothetical protein E1298_17500 [Actinomadura rubrisoli]
MKTVPPLEERLRDAYRAAADAWGPSTTPPLRPPVWNPRRRRGLAPVAAIVCVIVIAVAAVAIDKAHHRSARPADTPSPSLTSPGTPTRGPLPARPGRPRFMAVASSEPDELRIRDTGSGAVTARLAPPRGDTFEDVAVAGDDRTFIVTTRAVDPRTSQVRISVHRLRLSDDGTVKEYTSLPRLGYSTVLADLDMAVSPDGTKIAFVVYKAHPDKARTLLENGLMNIGRIEVVTIATGERRTWSTPYMSKIGSLSWAGSTLAFTFTRLASGAHQPDPGLGVTAVGAMQIRALDTGAPGDSPPAATVLLSRPDSTGLTDVARLLPDGRSLITNAGHPTILRQYSVRTGRPIRDLAKAPTTRDDPTGPDVQWVGLTADTTGRHLLAVSSTGDLVHLDLAGRKTAPLPSDKPDQDNLPSAW